MYFYLGADKDLLENFQNLEHFGVKHGQSWFWIQKINHRISQLRLACLNRNYSRFSTLVSVCEERAKNLEYYLEMVA